MKGNVVTFMNNHSEQEWDFQASFVIEENNQTIDVKKELKHETTFVMTSNKSNQLSR